MPPIRFMTLHVLAVALAILACASPRELMDQALIWLDEQRVDATVVGSSPVGGMRRLSYGYRPDPDPASTAPPVQGERLVTEALAVALPPGTRVRVQYSGLAPEVSNPLANRTLRNRTITALLAGLFVGIWSYQLLAASRRGRGWAMVREAARSGALQLGLLLLWINLVVLGPAELWRTVRLALGPTRMVEAHATAIVGGISVRHSGKTRDEPLRFAYVLGGASAASRSYERRSDLRRADLPAGPILMEALAADPEVHDLAMNQHVPRAMGLALLVAYLFGLALLAFAMWVERLPDETAGQPLSDRPDAA